MERLAHLVLTEQSSTRGLVAFSALPDAPVVPAKAGRSPTIRRAGRLGRRVRLPARLGMIRRRGTATEAQSCTMSGWAV